MRIQLYPSDKERSSQISLGHGRFRGRNIQHESLNHDDMWVGNDLRVAHWIIYPGTHVVPVRDITPWLKVTLSARQWSLRVFEESEEERESNGWHHSPKWFEMTLTHKYKRQVGNRGFQTSYSTAYVSPTNNIKFTEEGKQSVRNP